MQKWSKSVKRFKRYGHKNIWIMHDVIYAPYCFHIVHGIDGAKNRHARVVRVVESRIERSKRSLERSTALRAKETLNHFLWVGVWLYANETRTPYGPFFYDSEYIFKFLVSCTEAEESLTENTSTSLRNKKKEINIK